MKDKSKGVVLNVIPFKESSIIARIYTNEYGLVHFLVHGVRSNKTAHTKAAYFQPLMMLDLVFQLKDSNKLTRLDEFKVLHNSGRISMNVIKSSIALFKSEVLYKTIQYSLHDQELFEFIEQQILALVKVEEHLNRIPLSFLYNYLNIIGIKPSQDELGFLAVQVQSNLSYLEKNEWSSISKTSRANLLDFLLDYMIRKLEMKEKINSISILKTVYE